MKSVPADDRKGLELKQPKIGGGGGVGCPEMGKTDLTPTPMARVHTPPGATRPEASPPAGRRRMKVQLGSVGR